MSNQDSKERLKFWVTCPECGEKFGISPRIIFKYMNRLAKTYEQELNEKFEETEGEEEGS